MGIQSFKKLTGAALVAGGLSLAASVHAAISDDGIKATGFLTGTGTGEIFLSVFDQAGQRSISYDLGLAVGSYLADPMSYAGTLYADPALLSFIANTTNASQLRWNVGGLNNYLGIAGEAYGYLQSGLDVQPNNVAPGFNFITNAMSNAADYLIAVNSKANFSNPFDFSENLTYVATSPSDIGYHMNGGWGPRFGGQTANTEALYGVPMNLYFVSPDLLNDPSNNSSVTTVGPQWLLNGNGLQVLATTPVPVPAGIWLMGSALAYLGGMLHKVRERAAASNA